MPPKKEQKLEETNSHGVAHVHVEDGGAMKDAKGASPVGGSHDHSAQKRGPYVRLTSEERGLIIASISHGLSIPTIVNASGGRFKETTVRALVQQWSTTGSLERKLHAPAHKITPEMHGAMSSWLDDNPKLTLIALVDRLRQQFGVSVSTSTVNSAIRHHRIVARNRQVQEPKCTQHP